MFTRSSTRLAGIVAGAAFAALALPATAAAAPTPIGIQPTPLFCSGMGQVRSEATTADSAFYEVLESGTPESPVGAGAGTLVAWWNTTTGQWGIDTLRESHPKGPWVESKTQGGTILAAVTGVYVNPKGETCYLVPGFDRLAVK